jgi:membrane protease YdiL (CAAX protease family)
VTEEPRDNSSIDPNSSAQPPVPAAPPSFGGRVRAIFAGPQGLRAGWRCVLYVLIMGFIVILLGAVTRPLAQRYAKGARPVWFFLVGESESLVAAFGAAVVMSRIEKRRLGDYGLPRRGAFGKLFWTGALWGIAAITLLLLVMRAAGAFYFGSLALHGLPILKFAAFWGLFFLMVGFFEEFLMRGYTQFTLTQGMGFWPAAVLLSVTFGAIHLGNQGEAWVGALSAGLIGFFFCLTLRRTGTLWFAVGMHATWDWGESFLYSVPDSGQVAPGHLLNSSFQGPAWLTGGTVGPEGSVLVFVVIALLWVAVDRLYPDVKYGAPSAEAPPSTLPASSALP